MDFIGSVMQFVLSIISQIGYVGIAALMALESMGIPMPSEITMPFSGWLAYNGTFELALVITFGTLGSAAGSALAYWIGLKGGRPAIRRYGRYVMLSEKHLDTMEIWFKKYGDLAVFGTRLLPLVRTYISFPAGTAKMKFSRFMILSTIGSAIWCAVLAYIGFVLGPKWASISGAYNVLLILVIVSLIAIFLIWYFRRRSRVKCS